MKEFFLLLLLLPFSQRSAGRVFDTFFCFPAAPAANRVDALSDTVMFDFSHATCHGNTVDIPVLYTASSDRYAIDFAMRYDQVRLTYQSITVNQAGVTASAYYNAPDSTLRFTSFCFTPIPQQVPVATVHFTCSSLPATEHDVDTVFAYLDGNRCSYLLLPARPPAGISFSGMPTVQEGDSLVLTATAGPGCSYGWNTGAITQSISVYAAGTYTVCVTDAGGCATSALVNVSAAAPLPVEWLDFRAEAKDLQITLRWTTATETGNAYFLVERSEDNMQWTIIARNPGAGSSSSPLQYEAVDIVPSPGLYYYRLKQVDFDGRIQPCPRILAIYAQAVSGFRFGPNPVSGLFHYTAGDDGVIAVYSLSGTEVFRKALRAGEEYESNTHAWAAGVYTLRFSSGMNTVNFKLIISAD